ncbi:MAG: hypothetical protein COA91_06800 [Robiginitomaculum sp.]|nr:MAG: hypothetical protein COA91_06800 [Robiginitomaculum sp.]
MNGTLLNGTLLNGTLLNGQNIGTRCRPALIDITAPIGRLFAKKQCGCRSTSMITAGLPARKHLILFRF